MEWPKGTVWVNLNHNIYIIEENENEILILTHLKRAQHPFLVCVGKTYSSRNIKEPIFIKAKNRVSFVDN